MKKIAVIVAGGSGSRMGASVPKQFLVLKGKPILAHTVERFLASYSDMELVLVLPEAHLEFGLELVQNSSDPKRIKVVAGGATRFHSVANGLKEVKEPSIVFVHDGVRCLVDTAIVHRCYEMALEKGNAVPAIEAVDSLRLVSDNGNTALDRSKVRMIQTPQTFSSELILRAFEQGYDPLFTDEASVVERMEVAIHLVEGSANNLKITRPMDLVIAAMILENEASAS
jgi:2-C-methyl-D-erythritol 4-phosphate cytidylyltransferase